MRFPLVGLLVLTLLMSCRQAEEGAVHVTVLGDTPKVVDPAAGPLDAGEAVLLASVAQGLVRFDPVGNIEPGLAERWNVSDDGLSYIFRLATGEWPDGRKIVARDVARILKRQLARTSRNSLKDTVGAIADVVPMTERVIEVRLVAPRPQLLQLLAQPEFALVREGVGTGPFQLRDGAAVNGALRLRREIPAPDGREAEQERVDLLGRDVGAAIKAFIAGDTDLVLGGTFANLGSALGASLPRGSLRFDPVAGLFGLMPARSSGPLAEPEVRSLLDRAIDRPALVAALGVPDLEPRASILQPGLEGVVNAAVPDWAALPLAERQAELVAEAERLFEAERPTIRIALPDGPGAAIVLQRLRTDWAPLGIAVEAAGRDAPADLRFVDLVAPSLSPAWFLRQFRCEVAPICSEETDKLLAAARTTPFAPQRNALLGEAERQMRQQVLFMPIAAPVRWSLVGRDIPGFAENRFARHPLTNLRERPGQGRE
ncbi:ABC transporter substrate-binding protein [Sphingomonas arenae]|uniref:ABC transporter substrate-binding protein n=1 Tax=Sphingomonas arenae TaxID=2812555 RepID=UPI001967640A|nr:ABC transporter substrate-binding protein [Sphingomonas arenae]